MSGETGSLVLEGLLSLEPRGKACPGPDSSVSRGDRRNDSTGGWTPP